jgi:hypothetical protein
VAAVDRPRRTRWTCLALIGVLGGFTAHRAVSQERSSDEIAWTRKFQLTDGRTFVTDGAITLDASLVNPREFASAELITVSMKVIESYFAADLPDEFTLAELGPGATKGTYRAPSGVTLAARYVEYLRETLPASSLRLRMKGDLEPVVILSDGKAVGLLMPMKR